VDKPSGTPNGIKRFAIENEPKGTLPLLSYTDGPLIQRYAPGQGSNHTYEFYVERKKGKYAFFMIELYKKPAILSRIGTQRNWDLVCGDEKPDNIPQVNH
jgi:hypothetical protein